MTDDTGATSREDGMAPEVHFRTALREGRFELQVCGQTGRAVFFPRTISPHSGLPLTQWRAMSGLGTVHSVTILRRRPERGGDYNVVLVDLDEGARMMATVVGIAHDAVAIGMRVAARIEPGTGDEPRIVFTPVDGEALA